ncbi:histidine kinase [Streptomyces tubbatahanensis]|uniref:Histidine kinase n=1 Tax=Streptomyces tubbatahanensis TaxID=2923272 RepID=A0ABY3XQY9_9ACTN|nr:histidine kinase [Streptomyces tubbatahanensis]UNS96805.1 histidine kinase [Streptomyces tubbatahanensis]
MTTVAGTPTARPGTPADPVAERHRERAARGRGPGKYTFLPWLLMGLGALSHVIQGKSGNPWIGGAALLAFNSLYILVVFTAFDPRHRDRRTPLYGLAGLTALTLAVAVGYGGAWTLFFPLLSLASGAVRQLRGRHLGGWLIALSGTAGFVTGWDHGHGDISSAVGVGYGTFVSGMVTAAVLGLFDTVRQLEDTRQELARTAVERERLRFSRDLHDLLGHTLSVIVVKAEAVRRLSARDLDAALAQAFDIEAVGRQALTEIREAVSGYREGSLATELERARSVLEAAAITPEVRWSGPPLPPQTEALLGWVIRESVTNTVRHSRAGRCEIEVRTTADLVRVTVTDDGRGPAQDGCGAGAEGRGPGTPVSGVRSGDAQRGAFGPRTAAGPRAGTGLRGLAERLAAAGGTLDGGADGRRGFRVVAELPVDVETAEATTEERTGR